MMVFTFTNLLIAFGAGMASVLSPCVLPVLPIIVTGSKQDSKFRPLLIMLGLTITFITMGIISSIAGGLIAGKMIYIEKISGVIIIVFALLMLFDINPFKRLTFFNQIGTANLPRGAIEGFILGLTLGVIWIPCVGPILSSVLATVATAGQIKVGIILLAVYSVGFSVPMLLAAYSAQFFRNKVTVLQNNMSLLRYINGSVLLLFGGYIFFIGMIW